MPGIESETSAIRGSDLADVDRYTVKDDFKVVNINVTPCLIQFFFLNNLRYNQFQKYVSRKSKKNVTPSSEIILSGPDNVCT